jgi:hypothetical protein
MRLISRPEMRVGADGLVVASSMTGYRRDLPRPHASRDRAARSRRELVGRGLMTQAHKRVIL